MVNRWHGKGKEVISANLILHASAFYRSDGAKLSPVRDFPPNFFYGDAFRAGAESHLMPKKSKQAKKPKPKKSKLDPIPPGFRTVTPYLAIEGAAEAIEWYKKAFGAKELDREPTPDGKLIHGRVRIGDSIVMMSDVFPGASTKAPKTLGDTTVTLHIYAKDVDKLFRQAVDAGAQITMQLDNQFWGERYGQLRDPFGHQWSISQRVKMTKSEMDEKQKQAMAMFSQGQHPGNPEPTVAAQE